MSYVVDWKTAKLQWQAEALERFADEWDWERMPSHKDIRQKAAKLRRQMKGEIS